MTMVLATLLALAPAQQVTESGSFRVTVNGRRLGNESFTVNRSPDGYLATGRTEIELNGQRIVAESRMTLDGQFRPLSYEYASGGRTIRLVIDNPISEVAISGQEGLNIRFPPGGAVVDDNFFHHYVLLLHRLGSDGGTIPVFVPQQMTLGNMSVRRSGDRQYRIETENLVMEATVDGAGRLVRLSVPDSGVVVER